MSSKEVSLRITHLKLVNWKNFPFVEVDIPNRVFIVGPNASGKSNFLLAIRFLRDLVFEGGGLRNAVRNLHGVSAIRSLSARKHPDIEILVKIASSDEKDKFIWQYELVFNQDKFRRPIVKRERVIKTDIVAGKEEKILERPLPEDKDDPERLAQTHLEQVTMNHKFRNIVDFFASIRYLHIVPQLIREPDRSTGRKNDPYGGDFLEQICRVPQKTQSAWLRRINQALKIAVPRLVDIELWRDERGIPHLRGKYEHWRPQGAWQNEDQFSNGTLRLIGLLWSILEGRGPLLLEEPELSLHPEIVRYIPQMFAVIQRKTKRQIIVSTHSQELLLDKGIGLDEVLLLLPDKEATLVKPASSIREAKELLAGGISVGEIAMTHTRPERAGQLLLFGEK